jgi:hypothetical protein
MDPRDSPKQCATLARVRQIATKIFGRRRASTARQLWRPLVALAGIVILTATLAGRTFEVQLTHRPSVAASAEKAKIQHRDKQKTRPSPAVPAARPFYLLVVEDAVEAEQNAPLSIHIDDCLYNRPPPRS